MVSNFVKRRRFLTTICTRKRIVKPLLPPLFNRARLHNVLTVCAFCCLSEGVDLGHQVKVAREIFWLNCQNHCVINSVNVSSLKTIAIRVHKCSGISFSIQRYIHTYIRSYGRTDGRTYVQIGNKSGCYHQLQRLMFISKGIFKYSFSPLK